MTAREPRRHSKLYNHTVHRLTCGDTELAKAVEAIENVMVDQALLPSDIRRILSYLDEQYRWERYRSILQDVNPIEPEEIGETGDYEMGDDSESGDYC